MKIGFKMSGSIRSVVDQYWVASLATSVALILALLLGRFFEPDPDPLMLFIAAVAVSAWYGGLAPSLLAMTLSLVAFIFFFVPPKFSFAIVAGDAIRLIPFLGVSALICLLSAERRRAQRRLKESLESERIARTDAERASEAKDLFLAAASHELRTPLSAIINWVDLIKRSPNDPEVEERGMETIGRNARSLSLLVEDILDISRASRGALRLDIRPLELRHVVESAIDTLQPAADAKAIEITADFAQSIDPVLGDPDRLQQIVWNLVSNAVKFTSPGGRISINLRQASGHVRLTVQDTGKGIRPEFLPFVFDRFSQDTTGRERFGGLGLGLSIVRHLTELHGGTVSVHSDGQDRGSAFIIELPIAAPSRFGRLRAVSE